MQNSKNTHIDYKAYQMVGEVWEFIWNSRMRRKFFHEFNDESVIEGVNKIRNLRKIPGQTDSIIMETIEDYGPQIEMSKPARNKMGITEWKVMVKMAEIIRQEADEIRNESVKKILADRCERDKRAKTKTRSKGGQLNQQNQSQPQIDKQAQKSESMYGVKSISDQKPPRYKGNLQPPGATRTGTKPLDKAIEAYESPQKSRKTSDSQSSQGMRERNIKERELDIEGLLEQLELEPHPPQFAQGSQTKQIARVKKDPDKTGQESNSSTRRHHKSQLKEEKQLTMDIKNKAEEEKRV